MTTRRRRGEDGISFEHRGPCSDPQRHRHCPGLWRGELTVGYTGDGKRQRRKVSGTTKAAVVDKLRDLHHQLGQGITPKAGYVHYTVRQAAEDWLARGLQGRSPKTVTKNQNVLEPILAVIGARKLRDLTAADVRQALAAMAAGYSTAAVSMGHLALKRAIRHAEANNLVGPQRRGLGRHSQGPARPALQVPDPGPGRRDHHRRPDPAGDGTAAGPERRPPPRELMHAYIVLSLLSGIRTEEARALRWAHVDLDGDPAARPPVPPHVAVWRSVRTHGETKTERSRRTLALPAAAVQALRAWSASQAGERLAAGDDWQDAGLVFTKYSPINNFDFCDFGGASCGMAVAVEVEESLAAKFAALLPHLDERQRRLDAGLGGPVAGAWRDRGGGAGGRGERGRRCRPGSRSWRPAGSRWGGPGGRAAAASSWPRPTRALRPALLALVDPGSRGDPESPLRWTTLSTRNLAAELTRPGHRCRRRTRWPGC